jgi:hypothetical protein
MNSNNLEEGYIIMSFGHNVYKLFAKNFVESIRNVGDVRPVSILTDDINYNYGNNVNVINFNPLEFSQNYSLTEEHEMFGALPKMKAYLFSPYKKTICIDTDCFVLESTEYMWDMFKSSNQFISITGKLGNGYRAPSSWHWGGIRSVEESCGFEIPQVHGTAVYYDKSKSSIEYDLSIDHFIKNHKYYNIKKQFRKSFPDEIFFAMYFGKHKFIPMDIDIKYKRFVSISSDTYPFKNDNYILYHDFILKLYMVYYNITTITPYLLEKYKTDVLENNILSDDYKKYNDFFKKILPTIG